jgi:hypothetical protein
VAVVFSCGLLVGIVATQAYHDYQRQQKGERGLTGIKQRVMRHLNEELRLSVEQQRAIEPLMTRAERELLSLRMAQQPRVDEILSETIRGLKGTLNPDQQQRLDELYRKLQQRWESDREYVRRLQSAGQAK